MFQLQIDANIAGAGRLKLPVQLRGWCRLYLRHSPHRLHAPLQMILRGIGAYVYGAAENDPRSGGTGEDEPNRDEALDHVAIIAEVVVTVKYFSLQSHTWTSTLSISRTSPNRTAVTIRTDPLISWRG